MTVMGYPAPVHDYPGGVANSAGAISSGQASAVMGFRAYTLNTATSGSSYNSRFQHYIAGTGGSGAGVRGYALVKGVSGANLYGGEFSAEIMSTASSAITGLAAGVKSNVIVNSTASGTLAALDLSFTVASGKDVTAVDHGFLRVGNTGSGTGANTLILGTTAIGTQSATALCSTVKTAATNWTHGIRCNWGGTLMWVMATTTTPAT